MIGNSQPPGPTGRITFKWIGQSWRLFLDDAGTWVAATLIYGAVYIVVMFAVWFILDWYGTSATSQAPFGTGATSLCYTAFDLGYTLFVGGSLAHMAVKKVRGEWISLGDAFSGLPYVGHLFLYGLPQIAAAGTSVLISNVWPADPISYLRYGAIIVQVSPAIGLYILLVPMYLRSTRLVDENGV